MTRTDEPIKKLFKNKENFADLFNATIFQGEQVIKADKLIEISTEDIHIDNVSLEKERSSVADCLRVRRSKHRRLFHANENNAL